MDNATSTPRPDALTMNWWHTVSPYCEQFFDISSECCKQSDCADAVDTLIDMGMIFEIIRDTECPPQMYDIREELLYAMTDTLTSLAELIADQNTRSMSHLNTALVHLQAFHLALDELNLRYRRRKNQ